MSLPASPPLCNIAVTRTKTGVRILVPAPGWKKTPQFVFCLIWGAFAGFFVVLFTAAGWWKEGLAGSWQGAAVMSPFWVPWPFVFRHAVWTATAVTTIDIGKEEIEIKRVGWRLEKGERWKVREIAEVGMGDGDIEINDRPIPALVIQFKPRRKLQLFMGRPEGEMKWLAGVLNGELGQLGEMP